MNRDKTIFEQIVDREIPAKIIYEDNHVIAFNDIKPLTTGHFLVVPKLYSENLLSIDMTSASYLFPKAIELAKQRIKELGAKGYRLIVNNGKESGQIIFHTHIHIIPSY